MDPLKPVPVIGATPPIVGAFQSCQPQQPGIGTYELFGMKRYYRDTAWQMTKRGCCRRCGTRNFPPRVLGICTDCYADAIAVIRHEERLAA